MLSDYFIFHNKKEYQDAIKTLNLSKVSSVESFKKLSPNSKRMLIYNAWTQIESLFRERGNSHDVIRFLNELNYRESWHFANKTNIAFFINENDVKKITNPATQEKIAAYRKNYQDEYQASYDIAN
jgi:hypothetical protein